MLPARLLYKSLSRRSSTSRLTERLVALGQPKPFLAPKNFSAATTVVDHENPALSKMRSILDDYREKKYVF